MADVADDIVKSLLLESPTPQRRRSHERLPRRVSTESDQSRDSRRHESTRRSRRSVDGSFRTSRHRSKRRSDHVRSHRRSNHQSSRSKLHRECIQLRNRITQVEKMVATIRRKECFDDEDYDKADTILQVLTEEYEKKKSQLDIQESNKVRRLKRIISERADILDRYESIFEDETELLQFFANKQARLQKILTQLLE